MLSSKSLRVVARTPAKVFQLATKGRIDVFHEEDRVESLFSKACVVIIIAIIVCIAVFVFKFFYSLYSSYRFIRWARKQRLVIISGSPSSGKRLLLSHLHNRLISKNQSSLRFLGFFNSNRSYDVSEKKWTNNYCGFDQVNKNGQKSSSVFINEIEDRPFLQTKEETLASQDTFLNLYLASHFKQRVWVAFLARGGNLWKMLSSRTDIQITCGGLEINSFFWWIKFYCLKVSVDIGLGKKKTYRILIKKETLREYNEIWLRSFKDHNQKLLKN